MLESHVSHYIIGSAQPSGWARRQIAGEGPDPCYGDLKLNYQESPCPFPIEQKLQYNDTML